MNEISRLFYDIIANTITLKNRIKSPLDYDIVQSIEMISWAKLHKTFKYRPCHTQYAIRRNSIKIVNYLYYDKCKFNNFSYCEAIHNNNFVMMKWLEKHNIELYECTFNTAAKIGNLKILKWLHKKNCSWSCNTVNYAAYSGNLRALKFIIKKGCDWNINAFNYACESGNIKNVEYLFKEACNDLSKPWWNSTVCAAAAKNGYLNILQFLKEKGCPWNEITTYYAFINNHLDTLIWAIENKCPINVDIVNILNQYGWIIDINNVNIVNN